jgi:hypothetical protein
MVAVEIGSNLKVARLSDRQFRVLITGVWALAAKATPRGFLAVAGAAADERDVAHLARCTPAVALSTLTRMRALGMLEFDPESGLEYCHDWHLLNPDPAPSDTPEARRERKRVQRERESSQNGHADSHGHVTAHVTRDIGVTSREGHDPEVKRSKETPSVSNTSSSEASPSDPIDERLCSLLKRLATERNPKFKVRSRGRWLNDMRLLRERDGNSEAEIRQAIEFVFTDSFWGGVIQSPGNLREHFPKIWDRMSCGASVTPLRRENASDLLRAMRGPGDQPIVVDAEVIEEESA